MRLLEIEKEWEKAPPIGYGHTAVPSLPFLHLLGIEACTHKCLTCFPSRQPGPECEPREI